MRTHTARFLAGVASADRFPELGQLEIAFAGRSNVGKSALLNRLVGARGLARVSKTPGRTQQINFFLVDERVVFVDLPGYGFARVPRQVQQQWKALVEIYLERRRTLCAVSVLVDLRRGIESDDAQLLHYLQGCKIPVLVVATKADKLPHGQRLNAARQLAAALQDEIPMIVTSARSGDGIEQLWSEIERLTNATPVRRLTRRPPTDARTGLSLPPSIPAPQPVGPPRRSKR